MSSYEESKRAVLAAQLAGETTYHGRACIHCGGTLRFVFKNRCVPCHREKQRIRGRAAYWRNKQ